MNKNQRKNFNFLLTFLLACGIFFPPVIGISIMSCSKDVNISESVKEVTREVVKSAVNTAVDETAEAVKDKLNRELFGDSVIVTTPGRFTITIIDNETGKKYIYK